MTTPFRRFRLKVVAAIMLVVATLTAAGLYLAQRHVTREAERELQRDFRAALASIEAARATRVAALTQRCLVLVRKARIHAALEDDALDLLYPNARDELSDLMAPAGHGLHAKFYRFLDQRGAVIPGLNVNAIGPLTPAETALLALPRAPATAQSGYLPRDPASSERGQIDHFITTPIISIVTGQPIAALTVGFAADEPLPARDTAILRGLWVENHLEMAGLRAADHPSLSRQLAPLLATPDAEGRRYALDVAGTPHLLLFQRLNPGSAYPAAFEISLYSLAATRTRERQLRGQILGLGGALLLVGLAASQLAAARLARPVEQLAAVSAENVVQRGRAEAALELTQAELQRAARFSSDASHQLKTPVAVLRASLDELLVRDDLTAPVRDELTTLVHQTSRFTGMIEDLLLLSRMDEGRLRLEFATVDLSHLVASWLDDLTILPHAIDLAITTDLPPVLNVSGEKRYVSLILQNLLENARKYNRPGGRIHLAARLDGPLATLAIGNTGTPIPPAVQPHIFERFHRGTAGEDVPGHGLGLNLARELARLHGGELQLVHSADDWTEFAVSFRLATPPGISVAQPS